VVGAAILLPRNRTYARRQRDCDAARRRRGANGPSPFTPR